MARTISTRSSTLRESGSSGSDMASQEDMTRAMMEMMRSDQSNMENQSNAFMAQLEASRAGREERVTAPKIEKPATFSGLKGKDESDLSTFLGQCENQFRVDPRAFGTDGAKVGFAVSLLRGRAGEVVTSLSADEARQDLMESWEKFKEYLDSTFGDPDRKNAARRNLNRLEQTGAASQYFVEIERLAGIVGWTTKETQAVLVGNVERGLKNYLQVEIARSGRMFDTVKELSDYVVPLDERLHALRIEEDLRKGRVREVKSGAQGEEVKVEWATAGARPSNPVRQSSFRLRYVDGIWRTLNTGEFLDRKAKGQCFTCGSSAHRSTDCDKIAPSAGTVKQEATGPVKG